MTVSDKWRPHLDTLELLASNNIWLEKHIENTDLGKELFIMVCMLKKVFIHNNVSDFERELYKNELFILKGGFGHDTYQSHSRIINAYQSFRI